MQNTALYIAYVFNKPTCVLVVLTCIVHGQTVNNVIKLCVMGFMLNVLVLGQRLW